jgi:hypothetical protein
MSSDLEKELNDSLGETIKNEMEDFILLMMRLMNSLFKFFQLLLAGLILFIYICYQVTENIVDLFYYLYYLLFFYYAVQVE